MGQTITGSVTGTVSDVSGSAVAGAKVTAANVDTGVETSTTTNAEGVYTIRFLQIGHYKISIGAPGFGSAELGPFNLEVGQEAKLDAKLKAGSVNKNFVFTPPPPLLTSTNPT